MIKKFIAKKATKKAVAFAAKKEAKIIMGALLTIGTHKAIQKAARKYPRLKFLRLDRPFF